MPKSRTPSRQRRNPAGGNSLVRIIGGKWKGRKLKFSPTSGLRPTLSRTRETLFNWLRGEMGADLSEARCLDLFAGSGVLGLEALSQGVHEVCFVDRERGHIEQIGKHLNELFDTKNATDPKNQSTQVVCQDALKFLEHNTKAFDIVFIDPPFDQPQLIWRSLEALAPHIAPQGLVYVESDAKSLPATELEQSGFRIHKQTRAGNSHSWLLITS